MPMSRARFHEFAPSPTDDCEEVLAKLLASEMGVDDLRAWCQAHGVQRRRGDDKLQTARRAVEQRPTLVAYHLYEDGERRIATA